MPLIQERHSRERFFWFRRDFVTPTGWGFHPQTPSVFGKG